MSFLPAQHLQDVTDYGMKLLHSREPNVMIDGPDVAIYGTNMEGGPIKSEFLLVS